MKKLFTFFFALILFTCSNDDGDDTVDACLEASGISASNVTGSSASINWTDANNAGSYAIEYGATGFVLGSGTTTNTITTSVGLSNLSPVTTYDVYVKVICSTTNESLYSDVFSFTTGTLPVIPELRPTLSELNLFTGDMSDLNITPRAFKYELNTQLFSDYAHKLRFIALPENTSMAYDDDNLPIFPVNTVIAKTFFYNNDERDLSLGRKIIETRLLIKTEDNWLTGDYVWNDSQTEAFLDMDGGDVPVSWIDANGNTNNIDYEIPSNADCFTCHASFNKNRPIGPKLRSLNFNISGTNQLQQFINNGYLTGITDPTVVGVLPNWEDNTTSLEDRARAYIDMNCAHCHIPGGTCFDQSTLDLAFETPLEESLIDEQAPSIELRVSTNIDGISMPLIGTSILHDDGVQLILDYLESLQE